MAEAGRLGAPASVASVSFRLPRVRQRNLSEEVFGILRGAILSQEIPAGTRLYENDLAGQLEVSRAPIREAFRRLEQEGLIESFPRRGAIVVSVPEDEIKVFYQLRAEIEAVAFARAAATITDAQLRELEACLVRLDAAYDAKNVDRVLEADLEFHTAVMTMSKLTVLRRTWSTFDGPLRLRAYQLIEKDPTPERALVESSEYSHAVLLATLARRDPAAAERAIRGHILEVNDLVRTVTERS
jgi:DNA-binding GntR family transcriptional regulator